MEKFVLVALLVLLQSAGGTKCDESKGLILVDIDPTTKDHLDFFSYIDRSDEIPVVFLKRPTRLYQSVQFLVDASHEEILQERIKHYGITAANMNRDIEHESMSQSFRKYLNGSNTYDFENFHDYEDICKWLHELAERHPNKTNLIEIGKSSLGKPIYALFVKNTHNLNIFNAVVEGGIHGHEWLPIAFVTYLINKLLGEFTDENFRRVTSYIDWYLIPIVNPDGYEYSYKLDRFWRKNRRSIKNSTSYGVNLDRNFDYSWNKFDTSSDPKHENFCGATAFSEPETRALANFINSISRHLMFYFSIHSYGQNIIIPYSDSVNHDEEFNALQPIAEKAADDINMIHGSKYGVGTYYDTNGMQISGNSASWVKMKYNIKYVYTFEMQDTGKKGYFLAAQNIAPASEEIITAITSILSSTTKPRVRLDLLSSSAKSIIYQESLILLIWIPLQIVK